MTTLTVLGATGGTGVTTLAALAAAGFDARSEAVPAVIGHDGDTLQRRLGQAPAAPRYGAHEIVDGGRYTVQAAAEALATGVLALVAAATPLGDAHAAWLLQDAEARFGSALQPRLILVRNAAFGARTGRSAPPPAQRRIDIPFDHALAAVADVPTALPLLAARTRSALRDWQQEVRAALR